MHNEYKINFYKVMGEKMERENNYELNKRNKEGNLKIKKKSIDIKN